MSINKLIIAVLVPLGLSLVACSQDASERETSTSANQNLSQGGETWLDMSGSFNGWRQIGNANWRIENGEFVADSGNGHLVTERDFENVHISLEFWVDEPANSGVFVRASDPNNITQGNAYEVNIFDTRPDQTYRTGSIVEWAAPLVSIDTANQWNSFDILVDGRRIRVELNGVVTVDDEFDGYESGPISLQYAAGVVKFRNVLIQPLP